VRLTHREPSAKAVHAGPGMEGRQSIARRPAGTSPLPGETCKDAGHLGPAARRTQRSVGSPIGSCDGGASIFSPSDLFARVL